MFFAKLLGNLSYSHDQLLISTCLQGEITIFKKDERSRTDYLLLDSFNEETFLKYYLHLNQTGKFLRHKVAENGAIKIQVEFRASEDTYPIFIVYT